MTDSIDRIDQAILNILQSEGRLPVVELAKRVNLSTTPCTLRLRKLEKDGFIIGYHARINPKKVGKSLLVFISIKLKSTDEKTLKAFNAAVKPLHQILECHMTGGGFDYLLKTRVRDMAEFRESLGQVISTLPMVESTHSYFVMEEVKETAAMNIAQNLTPRSFER